MKKSYFPQILPRILPQILIALTILTFAFSVSAQQQEENGLPNDAPSAESFQRPVQARPNLLRELGLSRRQMQQIRRLNAERKMQMEAAQRTLGEARRNLDLTIYADNVDDSAVQARLKDFQNAQAEVAVIRSTTEYEIRKILTPEQVVRFRGLRQRFAEMREEFKNRPKNQRQNLPRNQNNRLRRRFNQKNPEN